jgi:hypothetical protein
LAEFSGTLRVVDGGEKVAFVLRPLVEVTPETGSPDVITGVSAILVQEILFTVKQGLIDRNSQ